ncbi:unnamed protein product [Heterobilharzia americana]|nr:unnamed protein product [Heterobilharzia americana]
MHAHVIHLIELSSVQSEVARAIRLKNEANKLTDQSELLDKEALEAQRYAVVASEMLKSLKQLWDENNNNAATNVNDEDNYIKEGDLIVPKINHDYLLDAEKSSAINSGDRNVDGDHSIDNHGSNSRRNEERRLSMPSSTRHTYNYFDDNDDFSAQDLLRGSDQNTRHLSETEQLTLEKIRLFILKQLIQQIKHEGKQTDERYYLNHHLTSDNDDGVTNRHGYHQYDSDSQHYNRKQDQYDRFSGIDLQPWLTFNRKGYGDEMNNSDERDLYGTE